MALIEEPERPDVFTFTWSIRNFSRCMSKENECLESWFYFRSLKLSLELYPKGDNCPGFVSLYLRMIDYDGVPEARSNTFMYVLSFQKCNGLFKESTEFVNGPSHEELKTFLSLDELHKRDAYLNHDVLTLRCRVWMKDADLSKSAYCFAQTKITMEKFNCLWIVEDLVDSDGIPKHKFKRRTGVLNLNSKFPEIIIHLSSGETMDDDAIHFAIAKKDNNNSTPLSVVYKIHLLHSNGSIVHSVRGEALFRNAGDIHKFPFLSTRKLLFYKELYFSGGKLAVQFESSLSDGTLKVKRVEYRITDKLKFNSEKHNNTSDVYEVWKGNMQQVYSEGKYSDLIVRTPSQEFPVHKAILCAQSEVFDAMLTHDMKEKNSGVIEIADFNDETVSKMLLYLYTNAVDLDDDIDYALAKDLYLAADKYRLTALQFICSKHLRGRIDALNVCDILLLADQLRDEELKFAARDLIVSKRHEILTSDQWKSLKDTNINLFAETMEWMILNK